MVTTRSQVPTASEASPAPQAPPQAPKSQTPYRLPGKEQESIDAATYNSFLVFEDFATIYRIPVTSPEASIFETLSDGLSKIAFLKEKGEKIDKSVKVDKTQMVGAPRIMLHHQGGWIHWNEGQIEYMVPCENEKGEESELAREFERLRDEGMTVEVRREWTVRHAVRIREWPDSVRRIDSVVS